MQRLHPADFHVDDILENKKNYGNRKQISGSRGWGCRGENCINVHKKLFGVIKILYILIIMVVK